jgi:hypothetical protein
MNRLLRKTPGSGDRLSGKFTLDELDDIRGYVAAEAKHTRARSSKRELDALYDRLQRLMESYDDGG